MQQNTPLCRCRLHFFVATLALGLVGGCHPHPPPLAPWKPPAPSSPPLRHAETSGNVCPSATRWLNSANNAEAGTPPQGGVTKEVVRQVIRSQLSDVKKCYEAGLSQNPSISGRVLVTFTIEPSGRVSDSVVRESDMGAPEVEKCIADVVRTWPFPQPIGAPCVVIHYPFIFRSSDPPKS
jgi:TonB family protein